MGLKRKKGKIELQQHEIESDEIFAFIAGYTEGGFPYGVTWDELECGEKVERDEMLPFN